MRGQQWAAREYYTTLDALGRTLYPLFCVSVHEHVSMAAGYGVWGWRGIWSDRLDVFGLGLCGML